MFLMLNTTTTIEATTIRVDVEVFFSTKGREFHQQISQGSSSPYGDGRRPICQVCGKPSHHAQRCWHRFDKSYQDENMSHAMDTLRITEVSEAHGNE